MRLDATADLGPVRPGSATWSRPRRTSASDGHSYVVKIRNGGNASKSFFNEFVASNIALKVSLSIAEPAIINLSAKLTERSSGLRKARIEPGPYFATRYRDGAYAISDRKGILIRPSTIANLDEVPAFVVFDVFVHNKDRHGGNTILAPSGDGSGYRYLLIDHGHCFGGPEWSSDTASDLAYEAAGIPWYTDGIAGESDFVGPADRMARLGEADIDASRSGLPAEWDIPADDYTALRRSMSSRSADIMLSVIKSNRSIIASMKSAVAGGRDA